MKKTNRIILGAALTIAACGSVMAGATYALFTSEAKTNIAITSGKVEVVSSIVDVKTYSGVWNADDAAYEAEETAVAGTFANGGKAVVDGSNITLDKITPMDKVEFTIKTKNNSTVNAKYRTKIMCEDGEDLFGGLEIVLDDVTFDGFTSISSWTSLAPEGQESEMNVSILMPQGLGNEYQDLATKISVVTEAVQGNAYTEDLDASIIGLYTKADLLTLAKKVNSSSDGYIGKTINMMNDIDLEGVSFPSIGEYGEGKLGFRGIFDGQGYTISNLVVTQVESAGLFGIMHGTAKNIVVDKATIVSGHYAGGIVGYSSANNSMHTINCTVTNSTITSTPYLIDPTTYDNGDKAGGIIGYCVEGDEVSGCLVDNCVITAYRDLGGIVGCAAANVKNNTVKNTQIIQDGTNGYKAEAITTYKEIIGRVVDGLVDEGNTFENVTLTTKN